MTSALPSLGRLHGVRVVCFYPWLSFESTGAWSRFACLWKFLLEQGAGVTLAFFEAGADLRLKDLSVRYLGEHMIFNNVTAITQMMAASRNMPELKQYSHSELDFLLRYEKGLYLANPRTGPWLDDLIGASDVVTCEYPMFAPLLSDFCKKWGKPMVVTAHDIIHELHGAHPRAKARLQEKELASLRLADGLVCCNDGERQAFAQAGLEGVTVLTTGDVSAVRPGNEDSSRDSVKAALKIKTREYCLFVGSAHEPNREAAVEMRRLAKTMPELTFVVAGNCCAPLSEGNFIALGHSPEPFFDRLYRGASLVLVPLLRGTGISVKLFQAFLYGKAVVSTPIGARAHPVADGRELLIAASPAYFPECIRRVLADPSLRLALGRRARGYAEGLDYRTHFSPYADLILKLVRRPPSVEKKRPAAIILVDCQLSDRVGHHFNYALALREPCTQAGRTYCALIKADAMEGVLSELAGTPIFSGPMGDDTCRNPFPEGWGDLRSTYDFLASNELFARELAAGLAPCAGPGDLIFLPNATPAQILGVALLLIRNPIYRTLRFVLLLRYSFQSVSGPLARRKTSRATVEAGRYETSLARLAEADSGGCVRLVTDSRGLAAEFAPFCRRPIEVLPIPHTVHRSRSPSSEIPLKSPGILRVVYMGDAREEKGFEFLPDVVRACLSHPGLAGVEFVVQAFVSSRWHAPMAAVIAELDRLKVDDRIHLIKASLGTDAYHTLLESADLVLLPYDGATYHARTSGPFVEAICAGKPVVVPRNSWMSDQLANSAAGDTFASGDPADLTRAVLSALENLPARARSAAELGRRFREFHNPQTFVTRLLAAG